MTQQVKDAPRLSESEQANVEDLLRELCVLHANMLDLESQGMAKATDIYPGYERSARNLLHYLALRRSDIRQLQDQLSRLGLSSLGQSEAHVRATLEAVIESLHQRIRRARPDWTCLEPPVSIPESKELLRKHTESLLGPEPTLRRVRIMVTIPTEAADDPALVRALLKNGMDCARINCAHDDADAWERMVTHLRSAERDLGKPCKILMDLAGPKLRTGALEPGARVLKWKPHRDVYGRIKAPARVWLSPQESGEKAADAADACLPVPRSWLRRLRVGDRVDFIDARGARRSLNIVSAIDDSRWAEALSTAYVVPGTVLNVAGRETPGFSIATEVRDVPARDQTLILEKGDTLVLTRDMSPGRPAHYDGKQLLTPARIGCTLPEVMEDVRVGERIWLDDGKIGGTIELVEPSQVKVRITHVPARGAKLRADKGINLPDSSLRLPALTARDIADLPFIAAHADLVGYSFVRSAADVYELEDRLTRVGGERLGIVLKIETKQAFEQLPSLLLASMRTPCDGVMIARGDLAIECGYERMAEVQEEILWICEAAHVPVIWATQVLESLAKDGRPSRAEISDAVIGQRAECVMLNKGPHIVQAVQSLVDILQRMEAHQSKKRSLLRPLNLARGFSMSSRNAKE